MEKLDLAVVVVGALILAVATVGAVVTRTDAGQLYALSFEVEGSLLDEGSFPWEAQAESLDESVTVDVAEANVTRVRATVDITPGVGAADFAYRFELAAPNGTSTVQETSAPLVPSGAGGAITVVVEMTLGGAPSNATVAASSAGEALASAPGLANATGTWTLTLQGAKNAPVPATVAWRIELTSFRGNATPTV